MSLGYHGEQINRLKRNVHIQKKRGASSLSLASRVKALELPDLSKRATPKAPRYIYSQHTRTTSHNIGLQEMFGMQCIYTPQGVLVALFLTKSLNFPGSNTSKPKRTVTPLCICPLPLLYPKSGFQQG